MTAISRALGRATEQLSKTSDTPRLDAEVLTRWVTSLPPTTITATSAT